MLLLVAIALIAIEAVQRSAEPASVVGTTVMTSPPPAAWSAAPPHGCSSGREDGLNILGAFLYMASDAAVSAGVMFAGFVMVRTG